MEFDLVSLWRLDAPLASVWDCLSDVEDWPVWWPCVAAAELVDPGDDQGLGARHRLLWTTALPYRLEIETRLVALDLRRSIEVEASGEVEGRGLWTFEPVAGGCVARYRWQVRLRRGWMRRAAPLLRPLFTWNHDKVMVRGERGLQRFLGNAYASPPASLASSSSALASSPASDPALAK